ncbi:hypothetical protein PG994_002142 [Apiospora phragmitis]|uniref:C2H2-type domain-containing protein n=1 Tax=Apiospora phragmitis TaxID=2905665 RepID=A0ABR1WVH7_9PEZI
MQDTRVCGASFFFESHLEAHEARTHVAGHSQIEPNGKLTCAECGQTFESRNQQQSHANDSQHSPFLCTCGTTFSRVDVLQRHIDGYAQDALKFPCKFCNTDFDAGTICSSISEDGTVLTTRKPDKPVQALETIRILQLPTCPYRGCEFFRGASFQTLSWTEQLTQKPFANQSSFTKHLKDIHKQTPFPCNVEDCDRVGDKGYVREKDLMKHRSAKHPDAPEYNPEPRQSRHPCGYDGCDRIYSSTSARLVHQYLKH